MENLWSCVRNLNLFVFAVGPAQDNDACPVEAAVNRRINAALASAEMALMAAFGEVPLSEIAGEIRTPAARRRSR